MNTARAVWGWLVLLLVLDLVVPWVVVGDEERFIGAFLFWVIWTAAAIISMFVLVARWRE